MTSPTFSRFSEATSASTGDLLGGAGLFRWGVGHITLQSLLLLLLLLDCARQKICEAHWFLVAHATNNTKIFVICSTFVATCLASLGPETRLLGVFCTYCTYFGCFFKLQSRMARKNIDFFYSILCLHAPSDCTDFQNFWYLLQQSILRYFCTMQPRVPVFAAFFRPLSTKGCFCSTDRRVVVIKCLSDKRCRRIC